MLSHFTYLSLETTHDGGGRVGTVGGFGDQDGGSVLSASGLADGHQAYDVTLFSHCSNSDGKWLMLKMQNSTWPTNEFTMGSGCGGDRNLRHSGECLEPLAALVEHLKNSLKNIISTYRYLNPFMRFFLLESWCRWYSPQKLSSAILSTNLIIQMKPKLPPPPNLDSRHRLEGVNIREAGEACEALVGSRVVFLAASTEFISMPKVWYYAGQNTLF